MAKQQLKPNPPLTAACYGRMYEETFRFCIECIDKKACKEEFDARGGDTFWPLGAPERNYKPPVPTPDHQ